MFNPVAGIAVRNVPHLSHDGGMNMAADNAVAVLCLGIVGDRVFKVADELDRSLHTLFDSTAEATIRHVKSFPDAIDHVVQPHQRLVG